MLKDFQIGKILQGFREHSLGLPCSFPIPLQHPPSGPLYLAHTLCTSLLEHSPPQKANHTAFPVIVTAIQAQNRQVVFSWTRQNYMHLQGLSQREKGFLSLSDNLTSSLKYPAWLLRFLSLDTTSHTHKQMQ